MYSCRPEHLIENDNQALRFVAARHPRDALATRLRQDGHPIRNARLTPLLDALKHDAADAN